MPAHPAPEEEEFQAEDDSMQRNSVHSPEDEVVRVEEESMQPNSVHSPEEEVVRVEEEEAMSDCGLTSKEEVVASSSGAIEQVLPCFLASLQQSQQFALKCNPKK
jgi:hypothetical protein